MGLGNYDNKHYCASVKTGSLSSVERQGLYAKFSVPISSFSCPFPQEQISQVSFPLHKEYHHIPMHNLNVIPVHRKNCNTCMPGASSQGISTLHSLRDWYIVPVHEKGIHS